MTHCYEYPRPALTVDALALRGEGEGREVLLVRRGAEPFEGMWALPGGFVDEGELVEDALRRELREETGLIAGELRQFATYGDPGRDPRGWTVSVVWLVRIEGDDEPVCGDDASEAAWHPVSALPPLAFDHTVIVGDALAR